MKHVKPPSGRCCFVFGLPGSGKTTVIHMLTGSSKELIGCISSGDIARRLSTEEDKKFMAEGNLFPHEDALREEILQRITKQRSDGVELIFIEGFPRFDGQIRWCLENTLLGGDDAYLVQIIGEDLAFRVSSRMRDDQDELDKFEKKLADQSKKIAEMEKLIHYYAINYYCIPNTNLEVAVKTLAKHVGLRK